MAAKAASSAKGTDSRDQAIRQNGGRTPRTMLFHSAA